MIDGVTNVRDLGSAGLRPGVVYRSATLAKATAAGVAALSELGVTTVVDFRTPEEVELHGSDQLPDGVELVSAPVSGGSTADWEQLLPSLTTADETARFMEGLYRSYVTDPAARSTFAAALRLLADSEGAVLFHCTAGKDRTGFTAAILLSLVGVAREHVYDDYLQSAVELRQTTAELRELLVSFNLDADALAPLLSVQRSFLDAAFDQIQRDHGDVERFAADGLGLGSDIVERLRQRLLA